MSNGVSDPNDLVRIADLIRLAAQAARIFSTSGADGLTSKITDAVARIESGADDLDEAGRALVAERNVSD